MSRKQLPVFILAAVTIAAFIGELAANGDQATSSPASKKPEEISHGAPWKSPASGAAGRPQDLEQFGWRVGAWLSESWEGEGARRYRTKLVYAWDLNKKALVETSYRVYEDGREKLALKAVLFPHGGRNGVPTFIFFDDGLFADALWIDDGKNVQRLDCDLVWPNGRTAQVRDLFVRTADDRIHWTMYYSRNGKADDEPAFETVLRKVSP